jgi:hypothetical protein
VQGIDRDDLVKLIYEHLAKVNVRRSASDAPPFLVVRVVRNWSASVCPDNLSVQVSIALQEPVTILRNRKLGSFVADTWGSSSFVAILSASEAGEYVTVIFCTPSADPRCIRMWLPRCRTIAQPARSKAEMTSG